MKNQRGVTLIALVVTIIVLIILAGVAIAALTGENGLINRARKAKKEQIEGEVRDQVILAIFNAKLAAENQATKQAGYKADAHITGVTDKTDTDFDVVFDALTEDLNNTNNKGFTVTADSTNKCYKVTYTTTAYQQACNQPTADVATKATISVDLKVTGNSISIDTDKTDSENGWVYGQYNA